MTALFSHAGRPDAGDLRRPGRSATSGDPEGDYDAELTGTDALPAPPEPTAVPAIVFEHVSLAFDDVVVLRDVSFRIADGDMAVLIGPSGSGKSVVLKLALGLLQPDAGSIRIHGEPIERLDESALIAVRDRIGMLFQESALFDSLTVGENVGFKLDDQRQLSAHRIRARVAEVLHFVGLEPYIDRLPAELSGGQRRRVAIARAMAAAPRLLLLDDPTVGLDPITAKGVIAEIVKLRDLQHVSALVVTHQLQDAFYIATHEAVRTPPAVAIRRRRPEHAGRAHFLVLRDGMIRFDGTARALMASDDPWIATSLSGWIPQLTLDVSRSSDDEVQASAARTADDRRATPPLPPAGHGGRELAGA